MIAAVVNALAIVAGSILGLLSGGRLREEHTATIVRALSLVVGVLGVMSAVKTSNLLCLVLCLVFGSILGEALRLEQKLDRLGEWLRARFTRGKSAGTFTEGFVTASLLFCIGSMAVMGSLEAGLSHNYSIIFSKSVIDGIMAVTFAAAMGVGTAFSALPVLIWQGLLTLLASLLAPLLSDAVVTEMSAVGGVLLLATSINMLGLSRERIRVGNMLPAILLPVAYLPAAHWLATIF